jgi:hypothetical protein
LIKNLQIQEIWDVWVECECQESTEKKTLNLVEKIEKEMELEEIITFSYYCKNLGFYLVERIDKKY